MPDTTTATATAPTNTTTTDTSTGYQVIQRPDGKYQQFKKSWSQDKIDKYFQKQGWVKKDNKWYTQTGEEASKTNEAVRQGDPYKKFPRVADTTAKVAGGRPGQIYSAVTDYTAQAMPSIMGGAGGVIGAERGSPTTGAAVGGAIGEVAKLVWRGIAFNDKIDNKEAAYKIASEALKQGALQKIGDVGGEAFFKLLGKIPHAAIKDGIPFLPSELKPGGKIGKMIEDLLGNLAPSAKTMEEFKAMQSQAIVSKVETFAQGMAKFKGTSEEMGQFVQKALDDGRASGQKQIDELMKKYAKKGFTSSQAKQYADRTALVKNFNEEYTNQLVKAIIKTNKPEAIGALLISKDAALNEVRTLNKTLDEMSPETLGKIQNTLMRDFITKTLTGSKDPVAKDVSTFTNKFSGNTWKKTLDQVGEEKLKTIYGEKGYKNIEEFTKLVGMVSGDQKTGIGKMMNLFLFISPIRSGLSGKSMTKSMGLGYLTNRMAKVITSTEGIKITNSYVRATIAQSPKLVNLAIDEFRKFNQRSDEEYAREYQQGEEEYKREKEAK